MHIALTSHIIVPIFPRANFVILHCSRANSLVIFSFFIFFKVIKPESKLCHYKGRNSEKPCNNYISSRANFVTT
jgi:hypothetical protein